MSAMKIRFALALAAGVSLAACFDQANVLDFETDGRLSVTNDVSALSARVEHPDEVIPIDPDPSPVAGPQGLAAPGATGPQLAPRDIDLTLVGEIAAPTVNGQVVQATSVWMTASEKAAVSYNYQGATALGAIDFFTKLLNDRPELRSSITLVGSDANAVFHNEKYVYAAISSTDAQLAYPAVMERIRLKSDRFNLTDAGNQRVPLVSFAATSVTATRDEVYVTTGALGGEVRAYDEDDMTFRGSYPLEDPRWVAWDEDNDRVVVLQGGVQGGVSARLRVFQEGSFPGQSMTLLNTWNVAGANVAESKNTVEVAGGKAYVAAGPAGVQVVCLATGQVIGSVPVPNAASLGLDPSVVVTNAVTVDDDVMFISNGEAGVYAAAGSRDFDDNSCSPITITVLGRLRFSNLQSVNHVAYRRGHLYIAAGLGGVKVVDVDIDD